MNNDANEMQLVVSSSHNDAEIDEIKRTYNIQNKILAQKNEELKLKVNGLEKQLFQSQKQVLQLKNDKIKLMDLLKINSKRFNDIVVDKFEGMIEEFRSFVGEIGVDVEKKDIPMKLITRVSSKEEEKLRKFDPEKYEFDHYWENVNDDLKRRKSIYFKAPESSDVSNEGGLETLIEQDDEVKEIEMELEPEYVDKSSELIPIKRVSQIMEKTDHLSMIPYLGLEDKLEENNNNNNSNDNNKKENPVIEESHDIPEIHEVHDVSEVSEVPEVPEVHEIPDYPIPMEQTQSSTPSPITSPVKKNRRKSSIPRELKNLDTEKTKRWLGMDPLDDVNESTSERRRSRRRSLIVNYDLPIINRRESGKFRNKIYVDEDKENRVSKPNKKSENTILRNITNRPNRIDDDEENNNKGKTIFDLENMDMFGKYGNGSRKKDSITSSFDMLL